MAVLLLFGMSGSLGAPVTRGAGYRFLDPVARFEIPHQLISEEATRGLLRRASEARAQEPGLISKLPELHVGAGLVLGPGEEFFARIAIASTVRGRLATARALVHADRLRRSATVAARAAARAAAR